MSSRLRLRLVLLLAVTACHRGQATRTAPLGADCVSLHFATWSPVDMELKSYPIYGSNKRVLLELAPDSSPVVGKGCTPCHKLFRVRPGHRRETGWWSLAGGSYHLSIFQGVFTGIEITFPQAPDPVQGEAVVTTDYTPYTNPRATVSVTRARCS